MLKSNLQRIRKRKIVYSITYPPSTNNKPNKDHGVIRLNLFEFEAKEIFRKYKIPIPEGEVVETLDDARRVVKNVGLPVVMKAQILSGKRGLLGKEIYGLQIKKLLIYHMVPEGQEIYLGFTVDRATKQHVAIVSNAGGMDIEEIAENMPDKIVKEQVYPLLGLRSFQAQRMMKKIGYQGKEARVLSQMLMKLWNVVHDYDSTMVEINPAILTPDGTLVAVDARMTIDDNALYRHREFKNRIEDGLTDLTEREIAAQKAQSFYVELDGDIGIIGNGAGLVMATLDVVSHFDGHPANFLDLDVFGGITRCDHIAQGLLDAREKLRLNIPMVVRMLGTREEEGRQLLKDAGIDALETMELAAQRAVELASL